MSDYRILTAKECAKELTKIKNPAILIHKNPDGDAVGSAAALSEIFSQLGEAAVIACVDDVPERLSFILEKTGAVFSREISGRTPITIDVASPSQLSTLYTGLDRQIALMIDHHAVSTVFADGYTDSEASSAAEALLDIADELIGENKISLTPSLAYAAYTAITSDTGCFCFSNASAKTYRRAAQLIDIGIDYADINHRLFHSKTDKQLKAEGFVATKIRTACNGKVAYASVCIKEREALSIPLAFFDSGIEIVRSMLGAEIAVLIKETAPGEYKVSMRSTGKNVASIAAKFSGGGHIRAAGCTVMAADIDLAQDMILKEIKNILD